MWAWDVRGLDDAKSTCRLGRNKNCSLAHYLFRQFALATNLYFTLLTLPTIQCLNS